MAAKPWIDPRSMHHGSATPSGAERVAPPPDRGCGGSGGPPRHKMEYSPHTPSAALALAQLTG